MVILVDYDFCYIRLASNNNSLIGEIIMNAYCTLENIKTRLNITGTTYDVDLFRVINNISRDIDKLCKRKFYCYEGTYYFDGAGRMLEFSAAPDVLSITTFLLDDGSQAYGTTLAITDYVLYPLNKYPKTYAKVSSNSSIGAFASNVLQGVKITGVFGYGDGESATPYTASGAVVNTGAITNSATTHALATGKGALFSPGMTIRIDSEQMFVTAVSSDTLTFTRAVNGTAAAAHLAAAVIYIYQYPGPIVEAAIKQIARAWKRKDSAYQDAVGSPETGELIIYRGLDPDVKLEIDGYLYRRY